MNFKFYFLGIFFLSSYAKAQDRIVTKEGNTIDVYNVEISDKYIYYNEQNSSDARILKMDKNNVLMIRFHDGRKTLLTEENMVSDNNVKKNTVNNETVIKDYSIPREENEKLKEKYRKPVEYLKDDTTKKAKSFFCQLDFCNDAILADKNIEVEIKTVKKEVKGHPQRVNYLHYATNWALSITLKNRSTQIVNVDLGNSFFVSGNNATPYYIPTSTSTTNSTGTGVGVNLGSVANAFGVGGVVGTLAQGVTVGGENSNASTTVTYSQRYVSIPPMSSIVLEPQLIFIPGKGTYNFKGYDCHVNKNNGVCLYLEDLGLKRGQKLIWDEASSPVKIHCFFTYALDNEFKQSASIKTSLYVKSMLGVSRLPGGYFIPTVNVSLLSDFSHNIFFMGEFN